MAARNSACGYISLHIFNVKARDTLEFQRNSRITTQQNFKPDQNSLGALVSLPPRNDFGSSTSFCAFVRQHPLMLNQLIWYLVFSKFNVLKEAIGFRLLYLR